MKNKKELLKLPNRKESVTTYKLILVVSSGKNTIVVL